MGWWNDPRPFSRVVCLSHSEASESLEGDRKNLTDKHLPQYENYWVENADYVIRNLDYLGMTGCFRVEDWHEAVCMVGSEDYCCERTDYLANLHEFTSKAWSSFKECSFGESYLFLACGVIMCFLHADVNDVDLMKIINDKLAFNRTRSDHQRENRKGEPGQKRY